MWDKSAPTKADMERVFLVTIGKSCARVIQVAFFVSPDFPSRDQHKIVDDVYLCGSENYKQCGSMRILLHYFMCSSIQENQKFKDLLLYFGSRALKTGCLSKMDESSTMTEWRTLTSTSRMASSSKLMQSLNSFCVTNFVGAAGLPCR